MSHSFELGHEQELKELFERRFGHTLAERNIPELIEALARLTRSCGFESPGQYLALLRTLPLNAPMVQALLQTVTNNESYFFRDPSAIDSLKQHVLPGLIQRALETRMLRVWSAGCSTGEELYTISILLREMIPDIDFWNIALVGTDIDAAALARARRGHYKIWSLRVATDSERKRYFDCVDGTTYVLRRRFTRGATFSLHNLADPGQAAPLPGKFDLVLCRNVSIYMHAEARVLLARKLKGALAEHGAWVSGPSDPVPPSGFTTRVLPGLLEHSPEDKRTSRPPRVLPVWSAQRTPTKREGASPDDVPTWRPPSPTDAFPVSEPTGRLLKTLQPAASPPPPPEPEPMVEPTFALGAARSLADRGDGARALEVINRVIEDHPLEAEAYLLRALLFESAGRVEEACADLKRVTYLEPNHGEAYLRLGLLLARTDQREASVKALRNALVLGYGNDTAHAADLRQTAALQLMRKLRGGNDVG